MQILSRKKDTKQNGARKRSGLEGRAPLYSYHASRSQERVTNNRQVLRTVLTAEKASRALKYSVRRVGAIVVLLAVVVSIVNIMIVSPQVKVEPLDPSQTMFLHSLTTYQQAAQKLFASSFGNKNKITVNTTGISAALQRQFPELAVVSIKMPLIGHRPVVYLESTRSALLLTSVQGTAYLLDENGRTLGVVSPTATNDSRLPLVKDKSGAVFSVSQQALPTSTVAFIESIVFQLQQKHLSVASFVLPAKTSEVDVYLNGQHYFIKFNLADSNTAQQQVGTYLATRHYLEGEGVIPAQYIDVRLDGRAYYK